MTGPATCQAIRISLLGSGPKEICRPNGTTPDALAGVVLASSIGAAFKGW